MFSHGTREGAAPAELQHRKRQQQQQQQQVGRQMYARARLARQRMMSTILGAFACGLSAWRLRSGSTSFVGMLHSETPRTSPLTRFSGTSTRDVLIAETELLRQEVQAFTLELQDLTKDVRSSPLIRQRLLRRKLVEPHGATVAEEVQQAAEPQTDEFAEQQQQLQQQRQPLSQPPAPFLDEAPAAAAAAVAPTTSPPSATADASSAALDGGAAPLQGGAWTPATASSGSKVQVVSAGYDSGDIADFFIDDQLVPIIGSEGRRGINVVVTDPGSQRVLSARSYDVWGDTTNQNSRLASDLAQIPPGQIVLVALKDSGMEKLTEAGRDALAEVGCTLEEDQLDFRESYALIGVKGGKAIVERWSSKMLLIDATLEFVVGEPQQSATDMPQPPPAAAPAAEPVPLGAQPAPPVEATMPTWQPPPPQQQSQGPPPAVTPAPAPMASQPAGGTMQEGQGIDTEGRTWEEVLFLLDQLDQGKPR